MAVSKVEYDFVGKRALVTGAGRGIGRRLVQVLVKMGADVVAISKTQANLDSLKAELPSIQTVCVDLADWDATKAAVEKLGVFDFLINNAAILPAMTPFLDCKEEDMDVTFNVNLKAIVNVSQVVARRMIENKIRGVIVNISSVFASWAYPGAIGYCAMKAALQMVTKIMCVELGKHKIRVVNVRPTAIDTDMIKPAGLPFVQKFEDRCPFSTTGTVDDVAEAVVFALSDRAGWFNGSSILVDFGLLAND